MRRCTLLSRGCRWRHWDTGRVAGMPCHSSPAHRAPHSAIPGTHRCRHRHPWWGYTLPHFGIDTDYCSEGPSSRSHSLQAQREVASDRALLKSASTRIHPWKHMDNMFLWYMELFIIHLSWTTPRNNTPTLQYLVTFVVLYLPSIQQAVTASNINAGFSSSG